MAEIPNHATNIEVFNFLRQNTAAFNKLPATHNLVIPEIQRKEAYVTVDEQPKQRGLRFRYKCEGRSAGSIPGENSTSDRKTYPSIKIHNFDGPAAIVVVSCVTKDKPHFPHPHNLVGQDCRDGVCTVKVKNPSSVITFPNIGIQCCKRHDVEENLKTREKIRVDPYSTGYPTSNNNIDLNSVRLCFQVFLPDANKKFTGIVPPVVSQPIIDKKSVHDLVICRLSRQSGYASGGDEVFLLCEKINKDDIQVRFFEETDDGVCWEENGEFAPNDVHRQYAIVFKTPPYKNPNIQEPVTVFVQLRRPSDDEVGDPKPFQYIPQDLDPYGINLKRKKKELISDPSTIHIPKMVMDESSRDDQDLSDCFSMAGASNNSSHTGRMNIRNKLKKKAEEGLQRRDKTLTPDIKFEPSPSSSSTFTPELPKYSLIMPPFSQPTPINANHATLQSLTPMQLIQLLQKQSIGGTGNLQNVVVLKNIGGNQLQDSHIPQQFILPNSTAVASSSSAAAAAASSVANNNIIVASSNEAVDQLASGDLYMSSLDNNLIISGESFANMSGFSDLIGGPDSTVSTRDLDVGAQEMVEEGTTDMVHPKQEHVDSSQSQ